MGDRRDDREGRY